MYETLKRIKVPNIKMLCKLFLTNIKQFIVVEKHNFINPTVL